MISDYLVSYNTLDDIPSLKQNHLEETQDQYWYLHGHEYHQYAWDDNVFSDSEINSIIQIGKSLKFERGNEHDPSVMDYRRSFVSWIPLNGANAWIYEILTNHILSINKRFFQFELEKIERLQFTYYDSNENGTYDKHVDPLMWNIPHNRKLSVVVQLSDPSEYEGGELILYANKNGSKIEKKKGMAAFFPSYTLHECTPITKGKRYSLVAWVHGPAFK
jgi:PKHD-type hydroxylase